MDNTNNLNRLNIFIVYFSIISYTKVLGIYQHVAGIGLGNLNVLGIVQIVSLILLFLGLFINLSKLTFTPSPIKKFIIIYFVIVVFNIITGFFNVLLVEISLGEYLSNIKTIYIYVFFVFLLSVFNSPNDISIIFKIINKLAFVAAIVVLYQVLFVKETITHGDMLYDKFRYMSTAGFLIAFSFFIHFSKSLQNKSLRLQNILLSILTFLAVAIQMHRSILIVLIFTILVALFLNFNFKNMLKNLSITILLITIIYIAILKITDLPFDYFHIMVLSTVTDIDAGEGSFFIRFNTLANTFNDVFNNYPLFGRGFVWEKVDVLSYLTTFKAYAPTNDNTYTNVLICFGFFGFITYLLLIIVSIKNLLRKVRKKDDSYSLSLFLILIYFIASSFFGDYLLGFSNTIITLIMFIAISLNISKKISIKNYDSKTLTPYNGSHANVKCSTFY